MSERGIMVHSVACFGFPTIVGNTEIGVSFPANPAFIIADPLSIIQTVHDIFEC